MFNTIEGKGSQTNKTFVFPLQIQLTFLPNCSQHYLNSRLILLVPIFDFSALISILGKECLLCFSITLIIFSTLLSLDLIPHFVSHSYVFYQNAILLGTHHASCFASTPCVSSMIHFKRVPAKPHVIYRSIQKVRSFIIPIF